ncbi:MAG: nitroreductase [Chloroflexi bacterium HGW-Chloroflexi-10]|jgi:nitroreductase|nr:MAG: nitroreductase [Chloroflexi bacterium HGW-Chloroflexi-10]
MLELITKNRSYRRFYQEISISMETLRAWVNLARLSASGMNAQPLKYRLINDAQTCAQIFPMLAWAGYLKEWNGPIEGERPSAYILVLGDKNIRESFGIDHGIAMQSILLGAVEAGFGGCIIGSIQREKLSEAIKLPEQYQILNILALGKPKESVVLEELQGDDIRYYRDADDVHHVPKRGLDDLIV